MSRGRPKGSKNKTTEEKVQELIEEVKELKADEAEKAEVIDELDDLLSAPVKEEVKEKRFLGYHPITGAEVWK